MKKLSLLIYICIAQMILQACRNDKVEASYDEDLYNEISDAGAYTYFQNGALLPGISPSPHGAFKLRFNTQAQSVLDTSGEIPIGTKFPEGAVLVKEVYTGSSISLLVVMKKDSKHANSANGWLWAEYTNDGSADYAVSKKGEACIGCHNGAPNRDFTRTFDLH